MVSVVSSEVQRTLVKSPPELWAELSDPAALARHLGEFGDIRIVAAKPEERIEWEAHATTGTVSIKASGWGTKVKLSVTRETSQPEPERAPQTPPPTSEDIPAAAVDEHDAEIEPPVTHATEPPSTEPPIAEAGLGGEPALTPHRGLFSRLFRRRAHALGPPERRVSPEPQPEIAALPAAAPRPEPPPHQSCETTVAEPLQQSADLSAELQAAEEAACEEVTAALTAVLDALGAAHHRPFSRA